MAVLDEGGGGEERTSGREMRRSLLGVRVKLLIGRCSSRTCLDSCVHTTGGVFVFLYEV